MPYNFNKILKQNYELRNKLTNELNHDSELKNQLTSELISEDREVKRALMKQILKESLLKSETNSEKPENYDNIMIDRNETGLKQEIEKLKLENEKLQNRLDKIDKIKYSEEKPDMEAYAEPRGRYDAGGLYDTMAVIGEKIGQSYSRISDERKNSNKILINITAALEKLSGQMNRIEEKSDVILGTPRHVSNKELLSKRDIEILNIIDEVGKVTSEDIKEKFGYKNKNAACARLNRLEERGLLNKKYSGRKVLYYTPEPLAQSQ